MPLFPVFDLVVMFKVCRDGKQLLETLQTPVTSTSINSITAKADYSEASGHVLDVIHDVIYQVLFLQA